MEIKLIVEMKTEGLNFDEALSFLNGGASITRAVWDKNEYVFLTKELDNIVQVFKRNEVVTTKCKFNSEDEKATDWKLFIKQSIEEKEHDIPK